MAVAARHGRLRPRSLGDVLERAVAAVPEEPVAERWSSPGGKRPPWMAVDVEKAVSVVVEEPIPAAGHLGNLMARRFAVVQNEIGEPRCDGIVLESDLRIRGCPR